MGWSQISNWCAALSSPVDKGEVNVMGMCGFCAVVMFLKAINSTTFSILHADTADRLCPETS